MIEMSSMKSFFITLSLGLIIVSIYRITFKHEPFNDQYYRLIIALISAIGWYLTILIERKKHSKNPK